MKQWLRNIGKAIGRATNSPWYRISERRLELIDRQAKKITQLQGSVEALITLLHSAEATIEIQRQRIQELQND